MATDQATIEARLAAAVPHEAEGIDGYHALWETRKQATSTGYAFAGLAPGVRENVHQFGLEAYRLGQGVGWTELEKRQMRFAIALLYQVVTKERPVAFTDVIEATNLAGIPTGENPLFALQPGDLVALITKIRS